jgi:hypothetical protein
VFLFAKSDDGVSSQRDVREKRQNYRASSVGVAPLTIGGTMSERVFVREE